MIQSAIPTSLSLNIGGRLLSLDHPRVMGILNATPDSFYAGSRCGNDETIIANRARAIIEEGGDMIEAGLRTGRCLDGSKARRICGRAGCQRLRQVHSGKALQRHPAAGPSNDSIICA